MELAAFWLVLSGFDEIVVDALRSSMVTIIVDRGFGGRKKTRPIIEGHLRNA